MKAWAASSQGWDGQSPPQTSPQCDTGRCSLVSCPDCTMAGGGGRGGRRGGGDPYGLEPPLRTTSQSALSHSRAKASLPVPLKGPG